MKTDNIPPPELNLRIATHQPVKDATERQRGGVFVGEHETYQIGCLISAIKYGQYIVGVVLNGRKCHLANGILQAAYHKEQNFSWSPLVPAGLA